MDAAAVTELVFGGTDESLKIGMFLPENGSVRDLFCNICDVYVMGCMHHNGVPDTHRTVAGRMERRLGIKPIVVHNASPCMPFLADMAIVTKVFMGDIHASRLVLQRHGTPMTLLEVRFEIRINTGATLLENMCGCPLTRHLC